jgi:hypothetical protein
VFLRPHNEHLSALPVLAYKLLLAIFGASSYAPFMALLLIVHGITCLLLYLVARRRAGPWVALAPVAVLVVLGPAWHDLLLAFQMGFIGSVAAGLGMVLCLDRHDRRGDAGAAALLGISLLCSSIGLAMVVLAGALLVLERPRSWARLWVVGAPLGLYLAWYAAYGVTDAHGNNIVRIPKYLADALSAAVASGTGLAQTHASPYFVSTTYGRLIAAAAVLALVVFLVRGGRVPPLAWAALVAAVGLWTAECLSGSLGGAFREANQSRYQYASVALLLLAVVSLASARTVTFGSGAVVAAATVLVCASNVSMLDQRAGFWTLNSSYTHAVTGALEIARDEVRPNFVPEDIITAGVIHSASLVFVPAGPYFSAVDAYGSIADDSIALMRRPENVREAADLILAHSERLSLQPAVHLPAAGAACHLEAAGTDLGELAVGPGTLTLRVQGGSLAALELRRFASRYRFLRFGDAPAPFPSLQQGAPMALQLPRDRSRVPWRVRVVGGRQLRFCHTTSLGGG